MNELDFLNVETTENKIINFYASNKILLEYIEKIDSYAIIKYFYKITNNAKIKKIENLINELQLFLQIDKIKLTVDNLKGLIVFELSKQDRKILNFTDLKDTKKEGLTACVGKDTNNKEIFINIEKAPHLLIAGATGSGKSCLINSIITSLINKYDENKLKLILIDVKQVEFIQYNNLNNLAAPVVTEIEKAFEILNKIIAIMANRYKLLNEKNYKNIQEYNKKEREKLCYYVTVVDEFSDLIMQYEEIETLICRIAQLGRAAGIHLIIATQRPSAETVTGRIKANIPERIALSVTSGINSKIILDKTGAEKLTGQGDFIYKKSNGEEIRGQGALI